MKNSNLVVKLTVFDREWAALCAGKKVSDEEAIQLKLEYEDWIHYNEQMMERN